MKLLGVNVDDTKIDLVASRGGDFASLGSKVVAILSASTKRVHVL